MSNANRELLERFYAAFARRDGAAMGACYHPHAQFRDPVFALQGPAIGTMWRMLCSRGADLRVEYGDIVADAGEGAAQWQAWYTFSSTGRKVHNRVHARFRFADRLILGHVDAFDFWRWSRQALGSAGLLLGWTPQLRRKVCSEARRALERFAAAPG